MVIPFLMALVLPIFCCSVRYFFRVYGLTLLFCQIKMSEDRRVELLEVFEVSGEDGFQDIHIDGLVVVDGDVSEAYHRLHLSGQGLGNDLCMVEQNEIAPD